MCVALVAASAFAWTRVREDCGETVTSLPTAESRSPFLDAEERVEQPDEDRDRLVATLEADPAPIGEVMGAVGYHYEQWAQVSAYDQGIGVRTRDNPDFTMLDDADLEPLWSVQVETPRSAYDASAERYLVGALPAKEAPTLVALDASTGKRQWCGILETAPVGGGDPFATAMLEGEDVMVLVDGPDGEEHLVRLDGDDGSVRWQQTADVGGGDFLGELGEGTVLAGGQDRFRLLDAASLAKRPEGPSLALVSAADGSAVWRRESPAGTDVHVVGTDAGAGVAVLLEADGRTGKSRLVGIDEDGDEEWSVVPATGSAYDTALRAGRLLVRAGDRWSAHDVESGELLWRRSVPERPQFLPYGFELEGAPLLDEGHVLVGGTTALHTLALDDGTFTSAPLPTDGINTTFWPYQVAVSPGSIAVATNTGAAVVRRE